MIEVYAIRLSERLERRLFDSLLPYVAEEKRTRINRFGHREDAERTLMGDILVRATICSNLKMRNDDISFAISEYGKPTLEGDENFHFNISHSGEWVVCAFDQVQIGIDVECVRPIEFSIADRFFSKRECKDLMSKPNEAERLRYFYDLWTLKESYIKADGRGLSIPLDSFTIRSARGTITIETENEFRDCHFRQYQIDERYRLSVCATDDAFPDTLILKKPGEICREFDFDCLGLKKPDF